MTPDQPAGTRPTANQRLSALFSRRGYELLGELGRGGMGIVYLARHIKLDRKVAIKTLSPDRASRENSLRRFEREARTFAQIRHDNIAALFEFEDAGPVQYLALEFIDGYDLESERRRGKKWEPKEAARIICKVAGALAYTHEKGILHRDIKPGNVLIEQGTNRVVLTDFGLAKGQKDETLTATGFAVGTPAYMAPEQISDQFGTRPDGRSDIFSLGTVMYEMLSARHPYIGADDLKTMRAIVHTDPEPLHVVEPAVPESLSLIVAGMLEKKPEKRFPDAASVEKILKDWLEKDGRINLDDLPEAVRPQKAGAATDTPERRGTDAPPATPAAPAPASPAAASPSVEAPAGGKHTSRTTIVIAALVGLAMLTLGLAVGLLLRGGG